MHLLNSAHIGVAIFAGLFVLMLGCRISAVIEVIVTRRNKRARIEPCTAEYETSCYESDYDHDH